MFITDFFGSVDPLHNLTKLDARALLLVSSPQRIDNRPLRKISAYTSVQDLPDLVWNTFRLHPRQSNIMYFSAIKLFEQSRRGETVKPGQFWLVCTSTSAIPPFTPSVDFVLSCTEGPIGSYPVCIFTPHSNEKLKDESFIGPSLYDLAKALASRPDVQQRVFSIFAPCMVAEAFAGFWETLSGIPKISTPYYDCTQVFCTNISLARSPSLPPGSSESEVTRPANVGDIPGIKDLCYLFAQESHPFVLDDGGALAEATYLVKNHEVWVLALSRAGDGARDEIASIVATTRQTGSVAAITKVFTGPQWRKRGYAETLVRFVCQSLLQEKESIVLYVGRENCAKSIYRRVGFLDFCRDEACHSQCPHNWLEIGFDQDKVKLGHW